MLEGIDKGTFSEKDLEITNKFATTVMLVSEGYPQRYQNEKEITGIDSIETSHVFHAGTKYDGIIKTNGGRVVAVTSLEEDLKSALRISYNNAEKICYEGKYYRKDIGFDL